MTTPELNRPIVQVHTIEQWLDLSPSIQSSILQHIRLKDRLQRFLLAKGQRIPSANIKTEGEWVPCTKCSKQGWLFEEPRRPGIHPSGLGQPCLLRVYNEMIGKENREQIDPSLRLTFDYGHQLHHLFQNYGASGAWGNRYEKEAPIGAEYQDLAKFLMLEGHADADNILSVEDIPGAPIYEVGIVHEYKTIKQELFEKLTRPKPQHVTQAACYSAALNRPVVVFMYFNKNNSQIADFPVPFNSETWKTVYDRALLLKDHYEKKTAPDGTAGYHCDSCGFLYDCSFAHAARAKKK